jgi:hypothetical protein
MATKRTLALILLVPFALLTLYAVQQVVSVLRI